MYNKLYMKSAGLLFIGSAGWKVKISTRKKFLEIDETMVIIWPTPGSVIITTIGKNILKRYSLARVKLTVL